MFKSKINKIILGTAQFKRGYGTFNNSKFAKKDITKILKLSKKYKINTIDAANSYGNISDKALSNFKIIYKFKPYRNNTYKSFLNKLYTSKKNSVFNPLYCLMLHEEKHLKKFKIENIKMIKILKKRKTKKFGISIYNFQI